MAGSLVQKMAESHGTGPPGSDDCHWSPTRLAEKVTKKRVVWWGIKFWVGSPLMNKLWDGAGQPSPCRECMSLDC